MNLVAVASLLWTRFRDQKAEIVRLELALAEAMKSNVAAQAAIDEQTKRADEAQTQLEILLAQELEEDASEARVIEMLSSLLKDEVEDVAAEEPTPAIVGFETLDASPSSSEEDEDEEDEG